MSSSTLQSFCTAQMNMVLSTSQKRLVRPFLYVVGVIVILLVLWPLPRARVSVRGGFGGARSQLEAIRNETLGVQQIFGINLPSRPDKRDNIVLGSTLSGFRVDWVDGVTPDQVNPKSYPYKWNHGHQASEYAARRAHVNVIQRIVNERLGSAIIMEDDADWDVTFKSQLQSVALAVRALQGTSDTSTHSPYGDEWDIIWLGHCGLMCKTELPFYLIPNDPTVLQPHHFLPLWRDPPPIERPDDSRLICTASDSVCSIVYAVSQRGAQRLLSALSVNPTDIAELIDIGAQFDVALGRMCGNGYLRCFSAYPSLTGGYRSGGPSSGGSDIHDGNGGEEPPTSWGTMFSTMMNLNRIMRGEKTVHSYWDDAPIRDAKPADIPAFRDGTIQILGEDGMHPVSSVARENR